MIYTFTHENYFLSNFYPSFVKLDGSIYPTVENAYQAGKTLDMNTRDIFLDIRPSIAKKLGQRLSLRGDWKDYRLILMRDLLWQKFSNKELADKLVKTGDQKLIEGNYWNDKFWGVTHGGHGEGENHLGRLLMYIRAQINLNRWPKNLTDEQLQIEINKENNNTMCLTSLVALKAEQEYRKKT